MMDREAARNATGPAASGSPHAGTILEVDHLVKRFPVRRGPFGRRSGAVHAVSDISFSLRAGESLGLVGESGCGKSTVGRLIVGLTTPTGGRIVFRSQDLAGLSRRHRHETRRSIQLVFQDPFASLDPRMSVQEIIAEPLRVFGRYPSEEGRERVARLLELVGLDADDRYRYPHEFSGGQRQRIGIARALALDPEVLVLDEALSALDVSTQAQIINLLERLQDELGLAYLFISHDLSVVRHICDRVAVMYLGKIAEIGPTADVFERPTHPYTEALLAAVPITDPRMRGRTDRIVIDGDVPSPIDPPSGCRFRTRCWRAEEVCATDEPELVAHGPDGHPSACHFADTPP